MSTGRVQLKSRAAADIAMRQSTSAANPTARASWAPCSKSRLMSSVQMLPCKYEKRCQSKQAHRCNCIQALFPVASGRIS